MLFIQIIFKYESKTLFMLRAKVHQHKYNLLATVIILCAIGLRLFLIAHNWPVTDSEEGTMGLEAFHIAFRGEHPIYLYGQNYMGVGEAYLGAMMFRLFGVSVFSLRLGMLLLFSLFLILIYLLGSLLYGRKVACIALLLMVGGTENILTPEMKAVGGAVETLVCGSLVLLLASWLSFNNIRETYVTKQQLWQRKFAYSGWGLAAGLGLWSHLLVVPFIFCSTLLLAFFCRHELRTRTGLFALSSFIIGALPLIIYNITAPTEDNTLAVFISLHHTVYPGAPTGLILWLKQLSGTFLYTLPIAIGLPQIISNSVLPFYSALQLQFLPTILLYGMWSLGYITLLICSTWHSLKQIYSLWHKDKTIITVSLDKTHKLILYTSRLMMLICAWLIIISYMASPTAAQRPWSFRYLIGLMVILPAFVAPLVNKQNWTNYIRLKAKELLGVFLIILILIVSITGTLQSASTLSDGNARMQQQDELVKALLQMGITKIYSGYWVCDRIIFRSQEKIICAVLNEKMQPGLTRYTPYKDLVDRSKDIAYVFTENGDFYLPDAIHKFAADSRYTQLHINKYIVFVAIQRFKQR